MSIKYIQRLLAAFEVLGGGYGFVGSCLALVPAFANGNTGVIEGAALLVTLSVCSIVGGVELYRDRPLGRELSTAVQAAQMPLLSFGSINYSAFLLARITISTGSGGMALGAGVGGEYFVHWSNAAAAPNVSVGVNLLAAGCLTALWIGRRHVRPTAKP